MQSRGGTAIIGTVTTGGSMRRTLGLRIAIGRSSGAVADGCGVMRTVRISPPRDIAPHPVGMNGSMASLVRIWLLKSMSVNEVRSVVAHIGLRRVNRIVILCSHCAGKTGGTMDGWGTREMRSASFCGFLVSVSMVERGLQRLVVVCNDTWSNAWGCKRRVELNGSGIEIEELLAKRRGTVSKQ